MCKNKAVLVSETKHGLSKNFQQKYFTIKAAIYRMAPLIFALGAIYA